jgi:hypothetical protein
LIHDTFLDHIFRLERFRRSHAIRSATLIFGSPARGVPALGLNRGDRVTGDNKKAPARTRQKPGVW